MLFRTKSNRQKWTHGAGRRRTPRPAGQDFGPADMGRGVGGGGGGPTKIVEGSALGPFGAEANCFPLLPHKVGAHLPTVLHSVGLLFGARRHFAGSSLARGSFYFAAQFAAVCFGCLFYRYVPRPLFDRERRMRQKHIRHQCEVFGALLGCLIRFGRNSNKGLGVHLQNSREFFSGSHKWSRVPQNHSIYIYIYTYHIYIPYMYIYIYTHIHIFSCAHPIS